VFIRELRKYFRKIRKNQELFVCKLVKTFEKVIKNEELVQFHSASKQKFFEKWKLKVIVLVEHLINMQYWLILKFSS